jgi:class 3 adenylate cyclase/tetratricopeptide (TPR) repeat protein
VPGDFAFCPFCGGSLAGSAPARPVEERKIVSVLFCDLVGFTAASDAADPEDVRARLRPYHDRVRAEVERFGATVEKFIGDAVMAVFGAPVVHEDDAERAVRAGLAVLDAIDELNAGDPMLSLQVRIGVDTGEAVVDLGSRPERGEGIVTGDVVNTASRLQGVAPVHGVAVSESTYRQTERVFDYAALGLVEVKGKTEPLPVWQPLRPRGRLGTDITRTHAAPLAGREWEKSLLIGAFERAVQQRSCGLVTLVGEPGVGKSRLCAELLGYIEDRPGLVRWRQGHCLPYGDKIAFWALGEIVKAECGILDSDSADEAEAKLELALPADERDRAWLKARVASLVGVPTEPAAQEESFAAWRRFIESLAEARDTVLVFEDLHWADNALLVFLEYLCDWAQEARLLVVCTARPEFYEQHPNFGANARNAQRINLGPLTREETSRLIASLLGRSVLPARTQEALLEQAGGNPLYAEEFVRLMDDRGRATDRTEVPDSVQALIAARLDTLSPDRKSLLQDAAVIGKVFWAGAVAAMGGRERADVAQEMHELARKELVREARVSSMQDGPEYGFSHILVRDVCYAQIPRASRASRHRAVARWLEQQSGERVEDVADVLAHHYLTALELADAAGQQAEADEAKAQAVRYLALAAERAMGLDVERAEASLRRALQLAPDGGERPLLLVRSAAALLQMARHAEAKDALEEARTLYLAGGDLLGAGRAQCALSTVLWQMGDPGRRLAMTEAFALLEDRPGPELVGAYTELAADRFIDGAYPESVAAGRRALELAADLGLPEPERALGFLGASRCYSGERQGLQDLRRALELSSERGRTRDVAVIYVNLSFAIWLFEGPAVALALCVEGLEFCAPRGVAGALLYIRGEAARCRAETGQIVEALGEAELLARDAERTGSVPVGIVARSLQARLLVQRGESSQAAGDVHELAALARRTDVAFEIVDGLSAAANVLAAQGRAAEAKVLLQELEQARWAKATPDYAGRLPDLVRCAVAVGAVDLAGRLVDGFEPVTPLASHALVAAQAQLAEAAGTIDDAAVLFAEAAQRWRAFGNVPERGFALLGQGRCLLSVEPMAAEALLTEACDLFVPLGYEPALTQARALLALQTGEAAP